MLLLGNTASQTPVVPAPLPFNVSFAEVQALHYRPSDYRLSYGPEALQVGELWLPPDGGDMSALLILIHGGCWLNEFGIDHVYGVSTALADLGYAVFALEYRRLGDEGGGWPGTFDDIRRGIAYARQLKALGIPVERLGLLGHSAGGHLALLAGAEARASGHEPALVAGLAAITNVERYARGQNSCQVATPLFLGGTPDTVPDRYAVANPVARELASTTWLLHGDADGIVPLSQSEVPGVARRIAVGAGHFDWVHPETEAFQHLVSLLQETF